MDLLLMIRKHGNRRIDENIDIFILDVQMPGRSMMWPEPIPVPILIMGEEIFDKAMQNLQRALWIVANRMGQMLECAHLTAQVT